jgi:hypothetical protein
VEAVVRLLNDFGNALKSFLQDGVLGIFLSLLMSRPIFRLAGLAAVLAK